jgi:hypothetical protein
MGPQAGIPASIAAQMIGAGQVEQKGVFAPEGCLNSDIFLAELAKRDIEVKRGEEALTTRVFTGLVLRASCHCWEKYTHCHMSPCELPSLTPEPYTARQFFYSGWVGWRFNSLRSGP